MNAIPKTYKLISAHGSIQAPCQISLGNEQLEVPNNIILVFLADFGSAITTKLSMNDPYRNVNYGFYMNFNLIKSYFNNPLGKNIPEVLKNATILVPGEYYQDMSLSMPPDPKHVNQNIKKFPAKDFEKGIYNLPLNMNRAIKLRNAHKSNEPGAKNMSRFDILSQKIKNKYGNSAGQISFKLHEYVNKLSQRGGGYIFVDACRVVTGGGNSRYKYGNFTMYRWGLNTLKRPYGRMVNISNSGLKLRANNEATASTRYKSSRVKKNNVIKTQRGLRNLRTAKRKRNNNNNAAEFAVKAYGGITAPSSIMRSKYLKSRNMNPSRYMI